MKFVSQIKRTHYCGDLRAQHVGQKVVLFGWVDSRRDHGGLVFLDVRDRAGLVQVVINPTLPTCQTAKDVRGEYVLAVEGQVRARPQGMKNEKISTGEVEVDVSRCEILSESATPPFQISDEKVTETLRLKYRYLDLRSSRLQNYIFTRHHITMMVRNELSKQNFIEVETPILYKSTPEGARDYLVPSRVNPGTFFALPQSPQTLKQLLMISGFDRYFQIARCFRDEDLRADRQPEFSQIDIEMSFIDVEDILSLNEHLAHRIWHEFKGVKLEKFPRMTYQEAMDRFGSDKPDLRIPWELKDLTAIVKGSGFKVFEDAVGRKDAVKGLAVPGIAEYSRGQLDKLTDMAKMMGAKGLVWIKCDVKGAMNSPIAKFVSEDKLKEIFVKAGGVPGGMVFIVADNFDISCAALSHIRIHLAQELKAIDESKDRFLWVTDFPLFEWDANEKRWAARHHPFTSPTDDGIEILFEGREKEYGQLKAKAYDLVCNGYEIAGGSIRIYNQQVQASMFKALGLTPEETQIKFGFFLEALKYGTPPHGGIAWGMDRLVMIICGTDAIRDVIAFPKTAKATDLMADAPSVVARQQLIELGIRLNETSK